MEVGAQIGPDLPQAIVTRLRCVSIVADVTDCYQFTTECDSWRISKIGQHLAKVRCTVLTRSAWPMVQRFLRHPQLLRAIDQVHFANAPTEKIHVLSLQPCCWHARESIKKDAPQCMKCQ